MHDSLSMSCLAGEDQILQLSIVHMRSVLEASAKKGAPGHWLRFLLRRCALSLHSQI